MENVITGTVLVVDDDRDIVMAIAKLLENEGLKVLKAYDGLEALELISCEKVDLLVIDIMMPKLDGLSALMKIRQSNNIPVIVLSAKSEDTDKILGLSMGADDYITKPYNPLELSARVKAHLRRFLSLGSANETVSKDIITVGGLELDKQTRSVTADGRKSSLTATEYNILLLLMENAGRVFSAEQIYSRVWQEDAYAVENTVMVHIRHIREKIEINPKEPRYLKVVWGIGYKIEKHRNNN